MVKFTLAVILVLISCIHAYGKEICVSGNGLRLCVEMKGPCDLSHLISAEKINMKMDMFHISVFNNSALRVRLSPYSFYCMTEDGHTIVVDRPFYDSIELKTKLRENDIAPGEQLQGFLFFPSALGIIKTIAHKAEPCISVQLY